MANVKTTLPPDAAEAIANQLKIIGDAAEALTRSGLKREAIVVLIHDKTMIAKRYIRIVLDNLESLKSDWLT